LNLSTAFPATASFPSFSFSLSSSVARSAIRHGYGCFRFSFQGEVRLTCPLLFLFSEFGRPGALGRFRLVRFARRPRSSRREPVLSFFQECFFPGWPIADCVFPPFFLGVSSSPLSRAFQDDPQSALLYRLLPFYSTLMRLRRPFLSEDLPLLSRVLAFRLLTTSTFV